MAHYDVEIINFGEEKLREGRSVSHTSHAEWAKKRSFFDELK